MAGTAYWEAELVLITRILSGDYNQPYLYSDDRIREIIILAGMLTQLEVDLLHSYTFDVANCAMSPDPCDPSNGKDYGAASLFTLKAACIIQLANLKDKAKNAGISVKSDREAIDTRNSLDGDKFLINSPHDCCQQFQDAVWKYKSGNYQAGYALLSPFSSPNLSTSNVNTLFTDYNSLFYPYNEGSTILQK